MASTSSVAGKGQCCRQSHGRFFVARKPRAFHNRDLLGFFSIIGFRDFADQIKFSWHQTDKDTVSFLDSLAAVIRAG